MAIPAVTLPAWPHCSIVHNMCSTAARLCGKSANGKNRPTAYICAIIPFPSREHSKWRCDRTPSKATNMQKKIQSALISVFYKDGLEPIARKLQELGVTIYSTGGTQKFLEDLGVPCVPVESLTTYPSILGGRVKTLHPAVFGGILGRRYEAQDLEEMKQYKIPEIDLVIVDLYPFEETLRNTTEEKAIIEKIDISGT